MDTYWEGSGKYQAEYSLVNSLIPHEGECPNSESLETLRVVANAYYDIYNNGACNAHRFEGLDKLVLDSPLDYAHKSILRSLFQDAANDNIQICFREEARDCDFGAPPIHRLRVFEEALEAFADWAILRAFDSNFSKD